MFNNQTVVITGAGRGIGAAARARLFADYGAAVVVNDLENAMAEETRAQPFWRAAGRPSPLPAMSPNPDSPNASCRRRSTDLAA